MKKTKNPIQLSDRKSPVTRFDLIAIIVITVIYSFFALYDLGDREAPQSGVEINKDGITIDLGQPVSIGKIEFFLGERHLHDDCKLNIQLGLDSPNDISNEYSIENGSVFAWNTQDINAQARYIILSASDEALPIRELAVLSDAGERVTPNSDSPLFDEQAMVPEHISFRNGTYFDEIYHARTAYEFLHGISAYEWTHPPLGKILIAIGIKIFGMVPFGWRIVGTVFGILMIPFLYLFAKRLLKHSWLAVVTCLLLTFDFMHFAQTRIATIDVYVTFFIILMYYYMYQYYSMSFYDTPFHKTLIPLALSGLFMGLGIASKWTGIYAGIGLAILFFMTIWHRYREYRYACARPKGETNGISHAAIIADFAPNTLKTFGFCCIFFIAVPLVIYLLSYIPYMIADGTGIAGVIKNQQDMYIYHAKTVLDSTHPYSSHWYQWPIMVRPIWYFSGTISQSVKEGISSFGNPAVWWTGIAAFLYIVYQVIDKKDKAASFLVIGYLAQLVPWFFVTRLTFIYHYFPCVPFVVLMIGYSILCLYRKYPKIKIISFVYTGIVVLLFMMFYPVLSGMPVEVSYVKTFLKWFKSWVLI